MVECDICGEDFDSERGMKVHRSRVHGDERKKIVKQHGEFPTQTVLKLATASLLVLLFIFAVNSTVMMPSKDKVVDRAMNHIRTELKGGENTTLISSSDTGSTFYRLKVNFTGRKVNVYVTKDGKYIFFQNPTEIDQP
ncbi:MAG: hypothetical protein ABEJ72_11185 [Candidatus Aenigmatarchaeota archaeon]